MIAGNGIPPEQKGQTAVLKPIESPERGVLRLDASGMIGFANPRVAAMFGVSMDEIVGTCYQDLISRLKSRFTEPEVFRKRSLELLEQQETTGEDVFETSDGACVLHRYSTPVIGDGGKPEGRVEVYSDITFRRRLEREIVERNKELARLNEELRAAQEQLVQSEKLRVLGEMAAGVAHDLNNVLGAVLANVQLLKRMSEAGPLIEGLKTIELAALDGAETVRRIKELAKVGSERTFIPLDLAEVANDILRVMQPTWQNEESGPKIDIETDLDQTFGVIGNPPELREALANIILNAVQAMPEGGLIRITTGTDESSAFIRVADSGIGMSEDTRKRLFDPFFTTRGAEGTGLGMSIVDAIVTRHGGHVEVESVEDSGTTVTISLPALSARDPHPEPAVCTTRRSAHVLVADDEQLFGRIIGDMLSEAGHQATVVSNVQDLRSKCGMESFDLLVVDMDMLDDVPPEARSCTSVVALCGPGHTQSVPSGADMAIVKPVKMETLLEVTRKALEERG